MSNSEDDGEPNAKKPRRIKQQEIENLEIACEWQGCNIVLSKEGGQFYGHVSSHIIGNNLVHEDDDGEYYKCSWSTCNFRACDAHEITRHVKYHGYHAELRAFGAYVSQIMNLIPCMIQKEYNFLNNVDDSLLVCQWDLCNDSCLGILEFIHHVHGHVKSTTHQAYFCRWRDCDSTFSGRYRLIDHLKVHTKQHFIACPGCGHTFANKTKFVDHCLSQKPVEEYNYQCDYCLTFHPSERLLKKHMGQHIHHLKCPFCNMSCNKPAILARHVRYRHISDKVFKCSICEYRCKSKWDLENHYLSHIKGEFSCEIADCNFVSSSQNAMKIHYENTHVKDEVPYCCHICDKKYTRGGTLTQHLAKDHNLKRPPGFSRFLYKQESNGHKKLQSVRLESIDIGDLEPNEETNSAQSNEETEEGGGGSSDGVISVDILEDGEVVSSIMIVPEVSAVPPGSEIIAVGESVGNGEIVLS